MNQIRLITLILFFLIFPAFSVGNWINVTNGGELLDSGSSEIEEDGAFKYDHVNDRFQIKTVTVPDDAIQFNITTDENTVGDLTIILDQNGGGALLSLLRVQIQYQDSSSTWLTASVTSIDLDDAGDDINIVIDLDELSAIDITKKKINLIFKLVGQSPTNDVTFDLLIKGQKTTDIKFYMNTGVILQQGTFDYYDSRVGSGVQPHVQEINSQSCAPEYCVPAGVNGVSYTIDSMETYNYADPFSGDEEGDVFLRLRRNSTFGRGLLAQCNAGSTRDVGEYLRCTLNATITEIGSFLLCSSVTEPGGATGDKWGFEMFMVTSTGEPDWEYRWRTDCPNPGTESWQPISS